MSIRNDIKALVLDEVEELTDEPVKTVCFRVTFEEYAKLKVLSDKVGVKPSPLSKKIFLSGLSEAISGYFDASQNEFAVEEFAESAKELTIDLFEGAAK